MHGRIASTSRRIVMLACVLAVASASENLFAQNENETVGFRPTHVFESGHFGESLDTLNGSLILHMPIGQKFQINSVLSYGLDLAYSSKVWDESYFRNNLIALDEQVLPRAKGPFGIGFRMGLGRIYKDYRYIEGCDLVQNNTCFTTDWIWVAPDGSEHNFFFDSDLRIRRDHELDNVALTGPDGAIFNNKVTDDLTYTRVNGPDTSFCDDPVDGTCMRVETGDGLRYQLVKRWECQK